MNIYESFDSLATEYRALIQLINSREDLFLDILNRCVQLGVPGVLQRMGVSVPVFFELLKYYNAIFSDLSASAVYLQVTRRILSTLNEIESNPSFRVTSPEYSTLMEALFNNMGAISRLREGLLIIRDKMVISVPNAQAGPPVLTYNSFVSRDDIPSVCKVDLNELSLFLGPSFRLENFLAALYLPAYRIDQGPEFETVFDILDALILDLKNIENDYLFIINRLINYTISHG